MKPGRKIILLSALGLLAAGVSLAQFFGGGGGFGGFGRRGGFGMGGYRGYGSPDAPLISTEGGDIVNEDTVKTARETATHSAGADTPDWTNAPGFAQDVFTYARVMYRWNPDDNRTPGMLRWINDYPDSDLNFSYRLQQLTALKTDPNGRVIKLTDPNLSNYPFIFMEKAWGMELRDDEVTILRNYLLNGGVLWVDDFWMDPQWDAFNAQMKRVLPGRTWTELGVDHPLFHCVFDLKLSDMSDLQVPSMPTWRRGANTGFYGGFGAYGQPGDPNMHVRAWLDDKGRIMVLATHNSDNGDGFEREGEDPEYFNTFSEKRAYPLGINIVYYIMTH
jgi:hypothetical protein